MVTLVVGPSASGKSRFARELCDGGAWWLNLNPAAPISGPLACCELFGPGERPSGFRFLGSLHLHRTPLQALEALRWGLRLSHGSDLVVELPMDSFGSIAVFLYRQIYRFLQPEKIVAMGLESPETILGVTRSHQIETEAPTQQSENRSRSVIGAFRRAHVRNYYAEAVRMEIPFRGVVVLGSRFGSGLPLDTTELTDVHAMGLTGITYAEIDGHTFYAITAGENEPGVVTACADRFGCTNAHLVHPKTFFGLNVGLERPSGDHFAMGRIVDVDFRAHAFCLEAPAEPTTPVSVLHMGLWRTDQDGNDLGELRPWQV